MIDRKNLEKFNEIYDETYSSVLKFVVCKCFDMDDVNDIIQEIYIEVYKNILKNKKIDNIDSYLIGIAKNKIKKHYSLLYRLNTVSLFSVRQDEPELLEKLPCDFDIEDIVFDKNDMDEIRKYLKSKSMNIQKIFYLYYGEGFTIKEIVQQLKLNESYIKNCIYRTLKEMQKKFGKESD